MSPEELAKLRGNPLNGGLGDQLGVAAGVVANALGGDPKAVADVVANPDGGYVPGGQSNGPARIPLKTDATPPTGEDIAPVDELAKSDLQGDEAERVLARYLTQVPQVPGGQGATVVPESSDYLGMGGEKGKELVNKTFFGLPAEIQKDVQDLGELRGQEAEQVGRHLEGEQARQQTQNDIINQNYKNDLANQRGQLEFIQKKTQDYTNDLADQGKFWRNPANVISSIFTALLAFTGDPTVGVRLINQQIQNDLQQRRHLADMDLGALRSNLAAYRQIAGDKHNGDLLAEAEAQRVAAQELKRIAARFEGPKAKLAAKLQSEQLEQESLSKFMLVYHSMIYSPAHAENPAIAQAYAKTGKALPGVGRTPFGQQAPGAPGVPQQAGGPVQTGQGGPAAPSGSGGGKVVSGGGGGGGSAPSVPTTPEVEAAVKFFAPRMKLTKEERELLDKRSPGISDALESTRLDVLRQVIMKSGGFGGHLTQEKLNKEMASYEENARKEVGAIAEANKGANAMRSGMARLQRDAGQIDAVAGRLNTSPDEMLGLMVNATGPGLESRLKAYYHKLKSEQPDKMTMWEKEEAQDRQAITNFRQVLQGSIVATYHEFAGANQAKQELDNLQAYIHSGANWSQIKGYIDDRSRGFAAEYRAAANRSSNPFTKLIWNMRMGQDTPRLNSQGMQSKKKE